MGFSSTPPLVPIFVGSNGIVAGRKGLVLPPGITDNVKFLRGDGTWAAVAGGAGTVTSVALTVPTGFSVTGSPVTTAGTLAVTLDAQSGNKVLASPANGSSASPTFRALTAADIPALSYVTSVAATVPTGFSVSGSPITASGTLAITLDAQSGNKALFSPADGSSGTPAFRALVALDIPALDTAKITTGTFTAARMPAFTGDITTVAGAVATTLATVNPNVGSFTYASITVDGKGRITAASSGAAPSGTVTSVALALPNIFTISGSPVTTSGTLTGTFATQSANLVFAGPSSGAAATPTFRALVALDIPTTLSIVAISNLGTNGFVKTAGSVGTLSVDTSTYLTANQTITLSSDATGSGTTAIAVTLATVNSNVGSFAIATVTVNGKGLVTAASAAATTGTGSVVLATSPTIATPVITTSVVVPLIAPASDSVTAVQITKSDKATVVVNVDTTNSRVGFNNTTPEATIASLLADSTATNLAISVHTAVSAELITNQVDRDFSGAGNWTGTNWAINSGAFKHTAGSAVAANLGNSFLTAAQIVGSEMYKLTFTVSGMTTGTLTPNLTTGNGTVISANGTYTEYIVPTTANQPVTFTPTSAFDGSIDNISLIRMNNRFAVNDNGDVYFSGINLVFPSGSRIVYNSGNFDITSFSAIKAAAYKGSADIVTLAAANGVAMSVATASTGTVITATDATTAVVVDTLILDHNTSGTPAPNYGNGLAIRSKSTTTVSRDLTHLRAFWVTATDGSRAARSVWSVWDTAERDAIGIEASGTVAKIGFFSTATAPVVQQVDGAGLTNNATSGGTTNQIDDFTSLTIYATDAPAIRNDIYQLARKLKIVDDALRTYGLLT